MKTLRKIFIILTLALAMLGTIPVQASPRFNKVAVNIKKPKKNKKKTVTIKLTNLTKQQKKKKWTFTSSDKSVVTVKRNGKNNCKVTAKSKDGYAVIRAQQGADVCYALVRVGVGSENYTPATRVWAETAGFTLPGMEGKSTNNKKSNTSNTKKTNNTGKKDLDGKTIYKFGVNYIIGMTDGGVYVKPRMEQIAFSVEIVDYMKKIGCEGFYTEQPIYIHIITKADLTNKEIREMYGIKETVSGVFLNLGYRTNLDTGGQNTTMYGVVSASSKISMNDGTYLLKVSDGYVTIPKGSSVAGTYKYSLTIGGVTKSVEVVIKDRETEFKKYFKGILSHFTNAQAINKFKEQFPDKDISTIPENVVIAIGMSELYYVNYKGIPNADGNGISLKGFRNVFEYTPWWLTNDKAVYLRGTGTCATIARYSTLIMDILNETYNLTGSGCIL